MSDLHLFSVHHGIRRAYYDRLVTLQTGNDFDRVTEVAAGCYGQELRFVVLENGDAQTFHFEPIDYRPTAIDGSANSARLRADVRPTLTPDHGSATGATATTDANGVATFDSLTFDAPYNTYISDWVGFDPSLANGFHSFLKDANGKVVDASTGRISNGCIRTGASEAIYAFAQIGMPVYVHF